ncbi:hypothetical protein BH09ACT8_BH09ACT8_61530 [soil metagenome]
MTDNNRRTVAKYLYGSPAAADEFHIAVQRLVDNYSVGDSDRKRTATQMVEMTEWIYDSLQTVLTNLLQIPTIQITSDVFDSLSEALEATTPANWPRPTPKLKPIEEILETDGIPIIHIPRAEIVQDILDADDYEARIGIIEQRADEIALDCKAALELDYHDRLMKQVPLARRAVETYQAGYFEGAQVLAVAVCDTYLKQLFNNLGYDKMARQVTIEKSNHKSFAWAFNVHYALAPAASFLTPWWPGDDPLTKLSRHVSIHHASTDHMTKFNATIAIMFVSSMSVAINYAMKAADRKE